MSRYVHAADATLVAAANAVAGRIEALIGRKEVLPKTLKMVDLHL